MYQLTRVADQMSDEPLIGFIEGEQGTPRIAAFLHLQHQVVMLVACFIG
jgi:hypothetical protein